jgi:hydroxylamine reductase
LNYIVNGLSQVAVEDRKVGVNDQEINYFTSKAIFSTLTNVDFDPERFVDIVNEAVEKWDALKEKVEAAGGNIDFGDGSSTFKPESTTAALVSHGEKVGILSDADILSLRELLIYGIRGMAAYADHAAILGKEDDSVYAFMQ